MDATLARQSFVEDLRVGCNVSSPALLAAIAATPRERFLPPGPWRLRGAYDTGTPRLTDDDDPRHVYHDVAIAIDPARDLYNGQPSLLAHWMQTLGIEAGDRVLHVGCGTGYFTTWMARLVGASGRVYAMDIDADLAARARENLAGIPWADVRCGDGLTDLPSDLNAVLLNAGATHVLDAWLDALADDGRLLVPLTVAMPAMGPTLGKGVTLLVTRHGTDWRARVLSPVAIYSMMSTRDEAAGVALSRAFAESPAAMMKVSRLRRDRHEREASCWLHGQTTCVALP